MHLFSTPWKHFQGVEKGCIRNERVQRKGRTTGSGELWTVGFEVMQFLNVCENQCYSYCRTLNTKSFFFMITFVWYWRDPYPVQIKLVYVCDMIIATIVYASVSRFSSIYIPMLQKAFLVILQDSK